MLALAWWFLLWPLFLRCLQIPPLCWRVGVPPHILDESILRGFSSKAALSAAPLRITGMGAAFGADLGGAGCGDLAVSCSTGPGGTGPGAAFAVGSVGSSAWAGGAVGTGAAGAGPGTGLEAEGGSGGSVGDAFTVDAASACSVALSCTPFRAKVLRASSSCERNIVSTQDLRPSRKRMSLPEWMSQNKSRLLVYR